MLRPRRHIKPISQAGQDALDALLARLRQLHPRKGTDPAAAQEYQQLVREATRHDDTNVWLKVMDAISDKEPPPPGEPRPPETSEDRDGKS